MSETPLQQLGQILQSQATSGPSLPVSVDAVDAANLPPQTPWKWEEVCKLVGSLYLESNHRVKSLEEHAKSIVRQLDEQRKALLKENESLRSELSKKDEVIKSLRKQSDDRNGTPI